MTESTACFVCEHVFLGHPVLVVSHDDGDWQFLCGATHEGGRPRVIGIDHIVDADPTIREALDLPIDWVARREQVGFPWIRESSWADSDDAEEADGLEAPGAEVAESRPLPELIRLAKQRTAAFVGVVGIGTEDAWTLDLAKGTLHLIWNDGRSTTISVQVTGTYGTRDQTFAWAWEHPTLPLALAGHALMARSWGQAHRDDRFIRPLVHCEGTDLLEICAVTCAVSGAKGLGHRPSGHAVVCFTYVGVV